MSYWRAYALIGFGDFISTTSDLLRYDRALAAGRLLRPETLEEAFTPVTLADGRPNPDLYRLGSAVEPDSSMGNIV